jgi:hypothetical protein
MQEPVGIQLANCLPMMRVPSDNSRLIDPMSARADSGKPAGSSTMTARVNEALPPSADSVSQTGGHIVPTETRRRRHSFN